MIKRSRISRILCATGGIWALIIVLLNIFSIKNILELFNYNISMFYMLIIFFCGIISSHLIKKNIFFLAKIFLVFGIIINIINNIYLKNIILLCFLNLENLLYVFSLLLLIKKNN